MTHTKFKKKIKKCMKCGRSSELEIHHIIPIRKGGTNRIDNLVLLCKRCHEKADKYGNEEQLNKCRERIFNERKKKTPLERHLENSKKVSHISPK